MSKLRKQWRRKDVVMSSQRVRCQRSGAVLPFDCFDCAPGEGNYLQGLAVQAITCGGASGFRLNELGIMVSPIYHKERRQMGQLEPGSQPFYDLTYLSRMVHNGSWSKTPFAHPSTFRGICTAGCTRRPRARAALRAS